MFGLKVLLQPKWFYDFVCLLLNALLLYRHCRQELCFSPWRARGEDIALYVLLLKPSIFLTEFWTKKARSLVLKIKIHIDIWTHIYIYTAGFFESNFKVVLDAALSFTTYVKHPLTPAVICVNDLKLPASVSSSVKQGSMYTPTSQHSLNVTIGTGLWGYMFYKCQALILLKMKYECPLA